MDSLAITTLRTAAATGLAARYLARRDADGVAIIGCGAQALAHLAALQQVRSLRDVRVFDRQADVAAVLARTARATLGVSASPVGSLDEATRGVSIIVTLTPASEPFLDPTHVAQGTFVAAVGADNPAKSELSPALMAAASVITDRTAQCAEMGDLHHAIAAGSMAIDDVVAELADVVVDPARGRRHDDEIVVFDSTGLAIQDVAAAAAVYEQLMREPQVPRFAFGSPGDGVPTIIPGTRQAGSGSGMADGADATAGARRDASQTRNATA
jgi:ornithine cyclodeaminase/alanine dehydrogenase-like protein (mu-crystallin family)